MMLTAYLFYSFFGYLSGSVLYSYLIPKYFCHVDVRTVPSTPFQWPDRGLDCSASCAISGRDFCRCFWRRTVPLFR